MGRTSMRLSLSNGPGKNRARTRGSMGTTVLRMRLFMKMTGWFFRPIRQRPSPARIQRIAGSLGTAALLMTAGIAVAQAPAPVTQPVAPEGYTLHESIDLGGRLDGVSGSGA